MINAGKPIIVGMVLPTDCKVDVRISSVLDRWDRTELAETYITPTDLSEMGKDKIVSYAKYRIPSPTHVLFINADILPRTNTLDRLLKLDKDIVTGVYPIVTRNGFMWSVTKEDDFMLKIEDIPNNPFKVKYCGGGVMLVKFNVFEKVKWPYWKNVFRPGGLEKGADVYFCDKVRKAGYDIWCDPKVKCSPVRMTNLMSIVNSMKGKKQ